MGIDYTTTHLPSQQRAVIRKGKEEGKMMKETKRCKKLREYVNKEDAVLECLADNEGDDFEWDEYGRWLEDDEKQKAIQG